MSAEELTNRTCTLPVPFFYCSLGALNILFNLDLLIHQLVFFNGLALLLLIRDRSAAGAGLHKASTHTVDEKTDTKRCWFSARHR